MTCATTTHHFIWPDHLCENIIYGCKMAKKVPCTFHACIYGRRSQRTNQNLSYKWLYRMCKWLCREILYCIAYFCLHKYLNTIGTELMTNSWIIRKMKFYWFNFSHPVYWEDFSFLLARTSYVKSIVKKNFAQKEIPILKVKISLSSFSKCDRTHISFRKSSVLK